MAKKESYPVFNAIFYTILAVSAYSVYSTYTSKKTSSPEPVVAKTAPAKSNQSATPIKKTDEVPYDSLTDRDKFSYVANKGDGAYSAMACEQFLKHSTKFPTKTKMDWSAKISRTYWTDGDSNERGIIRVVKQGEAMNSFGAMLPFVGECEFGVNINTKKAFIKSVTFDGKRIL